MFLNKINEHNTDSWGIAGLAGISILLLFNFFHSLIRKRLTSNTVNIIVIGSVVATLAGIGAWVSAAYITKPDVEPVMTVTEPKPVVEAKPVINQTMDNSPYGEMNASPKASSTSTMTNSHHGKMNTGYDSLPNEQPISNKAR